MITMGNFFQSWLPDYNRQKAILGGCNLAATFQMSDSYNDNSIIHFFNRHPVTRLQWKKTTSLSSAYRGILAWRVGLVIGRRQDASAQGWPIIEFLVIAATPPTLPFWWWVNLDKETNIYKEHMKRQKILSRMIIVVTISERQRGCFWQKSAWNHQSSRLCVVYPTSNNHIDDISFCQVKR